ncbi:MAG: glucose-1-phosphate cytidylyltransferase [bacterium]|nr:glucose-1-phosphate cytidylyltransferase [bacterium]
MKALIFAGGYGTRISEESGVRPKPMVEIGGKPILWHVMKTYSAYGINDFVIACGYKSNIIKEYFANYSLYNSDVTFDMSSNSSLFHKNGAEDWKVTLVETGENASKSERLLAVRKYLGNETFMMTYGDGVSNVNIADLLNFHKKQNVLLTVTAVQPPGRFGGFVLRGKQTKIKEFHEKPKGDGVDSAWINGGYFVVEPEAIDYIKDPKQDWEEDPMRRLAQEGQLVAFKHVDFWHPMDTLRDKNVLEAMWQSGKAPWKVW